MRALSFPFPSHQSPMVNSAPVNERTVLIQKREDPYRRVLSEPSRDTFFDYSSRFLKDRKEKVALQINIENYSQSTGEVCEQRTVKAFKQCSKHAVGRSVGNKFSGVQRRLLRILSYELMTRQQSTERTDLSLLIRAYQKTFLFLLKNPIGYRPISVMLYAGGILFNQRVALRYNQKMGG